MNAKTNARFVAMMFFIALSCLIAKPARADGPVKSAWENLILGPTNPAQLTDANVDVSEAENRLAVQRQVLARVDEISAKRAEIATRTQNSFKSELQIESARVQGKKIVQESGLSDQEKSCSRQAIESFFANASFPEHMKYLQQAKFAKIRVSILNNQNSARPDRFFRVGMEATPRRTTIPAKYEFEVQYTVGKITGSDRAVIEPALKRAYKSGANIAKALETACANLYLSADIWECKKYIKWSTRQVSPQIETDKGLEITLNAFIGDKGCEPLDNEIQSQFALWENPGLATPAVAGNSLGERSANLSSASITTGGAKHGALGLKSTGSTVRRASTDRTPAAR